MAGRSQRPTKLLQTEQRGHVLGLYQGSFACEWVKLPTGAGHRSRACNRLPLVVMFQLLLQTHRTPSHVLLLTSFRVFFFFFCMVALTRKSGHHNSIINIVSIRVLKMQHKAGRTLIFTQGHSTALWVPSKGQL